MSNKEPPIYKRKLVIAVGGFVALVSIGTAFSIMSEGNKPSHVKLASTENIDKKVSSSAEIKNASESYSEQAKEFSDKKAKEAIKKDKLYIQPVTNEPKAKSMADTINDIADSAPEQKTKVKIVTKTEIVVDNTKIEELKLALEEAKERLRIKEEETKQKLIDQETARQKEVVAYNVEQIKLKKENIKNVFSAYLENYRTTAPGTPRIQVFNKTVSNVGESPNGDTFALPESQDKTQVVKSFVDKKTYPPVKEGEMLYAVNKIAINTDYSSSKVVVSEIISSNPNLNKAKVFGSFGLKKDSLVLTFNRLVLKDGSSFPIEGYAIDEKDYITTVRSDYDNHYIQKYGLFLAGSFIKGLATAVTSKVGQNSTVVYDSNGSPVGQTSGNYKITPTDSLILATGEVANEVSGQLKDNLKRLPTVTLDYGKTFGVIILKANAITKKGA